MNTSNETRHHTPARQLGMIRCSTLLSPVVRWRLRAPISKPNVSDLETLLPPGIRPEPTSAHKSAPAPGIIPAPAVQLVRG